MKCPWCGAKGAVSDERVFEIRGQVDGRPVRRCVSCHSGLAVGRLGRARLIPDTIWAKMTAERERSFGPGPTAAPQPASDPEQTAAVIRAIAWRTRMRDGETDAVGQEIFDAAMQDVPAEFDGPLQTCVILAPAALDVTDADEDSYYTRALRFQASAGAAIRVIEEPLTEDVSMRWLHDGLADAARLLSADLSSSEGFWAAAGLFAAEHAQTRPELREMPDPSDISGLGYPAVMRAGIAGLVTVTGQRPDGEPAADTPSGWTDTQTGNLMFAVFYGYYLACANPDAPPHP